METIDTRLPTAPPLRKDTELPAKLDWCELTCRPVCNVPHKEMLLLQIAKCRTEKLEPNTILDA
jgi:hypothetical protein